MYWASRRPCGSRSFPPARDSIGSSGAQHFASQWSARSASSTLPCPISLWRSGWPATSSPTPDSLLEDGYRGPKSEPPPSPTTCSRGALTRSIAGGEPLLIGYTSSIVALAEAARKGNRSLAGLVVNTSGEPMTSTKASILAAVNATPIDHYAFAQVGGVAQSCLGRSIEKLHVWDPDFAVCPRIAAHPDGGSINMFLWTTLLPTARTILVNVSNDDYGTVDRDLVACSCPLGMLGLRTTN